MYRIEVTFPTGAKGCVNTNGDEFRIDLYDADPGGWTEAEFATIEEAEERRDILENEHYDWRFAIYSV